MKRLLLTGTVRPERAILTIHNVENELQGPDGKNHKVRFNVYNNQITALIESENDEDLYTLRNIVRSVLELVTDVVGFLKGYAYDVEIVKISRYSVKTLSCPMFSASTFLHLENETRRTGRMP
jgi:hypothetical protein